MAVDGTQSGGKSITHRWAIHSDPLSLDCTRIYMEKGDTYNISCMHGGEGKSLQ